MCDLISALWKWDGPRIQISVSNWYSHGQSQKLTGFTEDKGWYEMHYRMRDGSIECRSPDGKDEIAAEHIGCKFPTFSAFMVFAIRNGALVNAINPRSKLTALQQAIYEGEFSVIKLLLNTKTVDLSIRSPLDGADILQFAKRNLPPSDLGAAVYKRIEKKVSRKRRTKAGRCP